MYKTKEEAVAAASSRFTPIFLNTFEGEGEGEGEGGGEGSGEGEGNQGAGGAGGGPATHTQEQVNSIVAREKKKMEEANKKHNSDTLNQLNLLKTKANMTEDERNELNTQIEELNKKVFSSEELAAKDKQKLEQKYNLEKEELTSDRDHWKTNFTEATVSRSITDAAVAQEAFNPSQIVSIIRPQTRLVEDKDEDGNVKGYVPTATVKSKDKEGNLVDLDVPVAKAIELLKEDPSYFNLFKGKSLDGLNTQNGGGGGSIDTSKMSMEQYKEHRAKEKKAGRR